MTTPYDLSFTPVDFDPFSDRTHPIELTIPTELRAIIAADAALGPAPRGAFHVAMALRIDGLLELESLRKAFSSLITRHDALRVVFAEHGPTAHFVPSFPVHIETTTAAHLTPEAVDAQLQCWAGAPFDLNRGPLFRIGWVPTAQSGVLLLVAHRLIADERSLAVLLTEWAALYNETGSTALLPALSWAAWLAQPRPAVPVGPWPSASRPENGPFAVAGRSQTLIRRINFQQLTLPLPTLVAGAAALVLHHLRQQSEVHIGLATAPQRPTGEPPLIAPLTDVALVTSHFFPDQPMGEYWDALVASVGQAQREAAGRGYAPALDRSGQYPPIGVLLEVDVTASPFLNFGQSAARRHPYQSTSSPADWTIRLCSQGDSLEITWTYDANQTDPRLLTDYFQQFETYLNTLATEQARPIQPPLPQPPAVPAASRPARAPQTSHELLVADVFSEFLGTDEVQLTDDFFELGGHSLLAVQVMDRLEKETQVRLPLSVLFEHPTVEKLGALLQERATISWTPLVAIRSKGAKPPIYIVHGAGSHVLNFGTLIPYLDPQQPVYALQAQGASGESEPLETIEEIASLYVEAILKNNPSGPYALAGYSFGGFIAFEMARQLLRRGKQVSFLGMIDAEAFQPYDAVSVADRLRHLLLSRLCRGWYSLTKAIRYPGPAARAVGNFWKEKAHNAWLRLTLTPQQRHDRLSPTERMYFVYYRAWQQYRLLPQEVVIDLFRTQVQTEYLEDAHYYGWRPYARRGVVVHSVPGGHHSMFKEPYVEHLSQKIQEALDRRMPRPGK
jgi:thioesterase domain-containing protein/acyl carrier protein